MRSVDGETVRRWFSDPVAVAHYDRAARTVGLWVSERVVLSAVFSPGDRLLDVGCGAGRVALGLWQLGFEEVVGVDFCEPLVEQARLNADALGAAVAFEAGDARSLRFEDGSFDGVVFAFNGLMQIPGRENRRAALRELARVTRRGGHLVFTTHDFERTRSRDRRPDESWPDADEAEGLDRVIERAEGRIFMHIPTRREVLDDLENTGWVYLEDHPRHRLANESQSVREFADECLFWLARRR